MSALKKILLGLVIAVAVLVLVGLFLPSSAHVERSITVDASPATMFALVNGYRSFKRWSPWAERDPETEYSFEGPDHGVGAKMTWASQNPQVGSGYQEVVASDPYSRVQSHLDFGSQGTAEAFFRLEPGADGTSITWGFDTEFGMNLVSRYMGLMFDRWIGADYEAGLANLKVLAEGLPEVDWTDLEIEVVDIDPAVIVYTPAQSTWDVAAIGEAVGGAYGEIGRFMAKEGLEQSGPQVVMTTASTEEEWQFDAGVPIAVIPEIEIDATDPVQIRETAGGMTVRGINVGPYSNISTNWDKVRAWAAAHGYEEAGLPWVEYVSDAGNAPEDELITHLCLPVR